MNPVAVPCRNQMISCPGKWVVLTLAEASCFGLGPCSLTLGVTLTTTSLVFISLPCEGGTRNEELVPEVPFVPSRIPSAATATTST